MAGSELSGKGPGLSIVGLARSMAAALLPQDCLLCSAADTPRLLCDACLASLSRAAHEACPKCALPCSGSSICGECLSRTPHFDATLAALSYEFPVDQLMHALKYQHRLPVADLIAGIMLDRRPPRGDLLLPVPLSAFRLRERGFNQSLEISRVLAKQLSLPLDIEGCHRTTETMPQAGLPWKERRRNVRDAFECSKDYSGRHVVVVDDVMTTGATLDELARTLKQHGAASVTNWVGARTARKGQAPI